jgi:uncharacterized membrane protein YphA (DoxX/SURF4 family)
MPSRRRAVTVTLWTAQVLLGAVFVSVAAAKLAGASSSVEVFNQIGLGQWLRYVTGTAELAGGIGLLIPRLAGLAALGLVGVMIGATIANLLVLMPAMALLTVLLGVASALIAKARWAATKSLVEYIRR